MSNVISPEENYFSLNCFQIFADCTYSDASITLCMFEDISLILHEFAHEHVQMIDERAKVCAKFSVSNEILIFERVRDAFSSFYFILCMDLEEIMNFICKSWL